MRNSATACIAVDWGTTNRRIYRLAADGALLDRHHDGHGITRMTRDDYPAAIAAIRAGDADVPVILAGMAGSSRGWHDVPYIAAPATIAALAALAYRIAAENVTIVPGVATACDASPDVMRGEEVQILGAIAAGLAPADALFCQPGTHSKWIRTKDAAITGFRTALTGELFGLLRQHSVLAEMLQADPAPGAAFDDGVARGIADRDLLGALFSVRAGVLLGRLARQDAASFASGVLIGADVASGLAAGERVHLVADARLGAFYARAIGVRGGTVVTIDSEAAFVAGINRIREAMA